MTEKSMADTFLREMTNRVTNGVVFTANRENGYSGHRWTPGKVLSGTVYFGISTVRDPGPRKLVVHRKTEDLVSTFAIVLDDVGTKVDPAKLAAFPPPTYKLETSTGNFQWGYKLKTPCEPARAAAFIEALAKAGCTDAGAQRADRIMRVPGSLNHKNGFVSNLIEWNPGVFYTLSELVAKCGIMPTDVPEQRAMKEALASDPLLVAMDKLGWVLGGPNPRGWFAVQCPQEHLHSGADPTHGADYLPGAPGVFKCQHEHCQGLGTRALHEAIRKEDPKAIIPLMPPEALADVVAKVKPALAAESKKAKKTMLAAIKQACKERDSVLVYLIDTLLNAHAISPDMVPEPDLTQSRKRAASQRTSPRRVRYIMDLIGMTPRQNVVTGDIEVRFQLNDERIDLSAAHTPDAIGALVHCCMRAGMSSVNTIYEEASQRAAANRYSSVCEWVSSKKWDGRSRIKELCETLTMHETKMNAWRDLALRRWLIQTIAAMRNWEKEPTDIGHVLVLQGAHQGENKSRWISALLPAPWVTIGMTLHLDVANPTDNIRRATRAPIVELGEIDSSFKRSDISALKNFLTTPIDSYRLPYGRHLMAWPRCTSFIGTVNSTGFLIDATGNRRFWPIAIDHCKWDHGIDMQQLWAEAWAIQATGEKFWLQDGEEVDLHRMATEGHMAETEARMILNDLKYRAEVFDDRELWVHVNARDLCDHYRTKHSMPVWRELNDGLAAAKFKGAKVRGKRGFWVPPYEKMMSTAERAKFGIILGDKEKDEKPNDSD